MCPHKFYLSYIKRYQGRPMFFSDFGTLMHKVIELYLTGALKADDLAMYYLSHFRTDVQGKAPNRDIFKNYFEQGLRYLENIKFPYKDPIAVERKLDFTVNGKPFTGVLDCVANEGGLVILDNKSRALKPRSGRKKPTKTDAELDDYLRQLYLYAIPTKEVFGSYPERLEFNCFRTGELISEPFREDKLEETKVWSCEMIDRITENEEWKPDMDFWKCRYLCDLNHECDYYQMNKG